MLALSATCAVAVAAMSLAISRDLGGGSLWPSTAGGQTDWAKLQSWSGTLAAAQLVVLLLAGIVGCVVGLKLVH